MACKIIDPEFPAPSCVIRIGPYRVAEIYASGGVRLQTLMLAVVWPSGTQGVGAPEYISFDRILDQVPVAQNAGALSVQDEVGVLYDGTEINGPFVLVLGRYQSFAGYLCGEGGYGDGEYGGAP